MIMTNDVLMIMIMKHYQTLTVVALVGSSAEDAVVWSELCGNNKCELLLLEH